MNSREIDALLRDNVHELVQHFEGSPGKRRGNEVRWGSKGGLKADLAGPNKGRITEFDGDGKGKSPLAFIKSRLGYDWKGAVEWAANWLGIGPGEMPTRTPEQIQRAKQKQEEDKLKQEADEARRIQKAKWYWDRSTGISGTEAEIYLRSRGITAELPDCPRYHSGTNSLICALTTTSEEVVAVQRTFLKDCKKQPGRAKQTNGVMTSGAVRLPGNRGFELVLCEGLETALSIWQSWRRETWAALGSLTRLADQVPPGREVVIAADADGADSPASQAIEKTISRLIKRGALVRLVQPLNPTKKGYDFNDVLVERGADVVRETLENKSAIIPPYDPPQGALEQARELVKQAIGLWAGQVEAYWREKTELEAQLRMTED